ncbi:MAG: hypothetical protein ACYS30_26230 [Planctomycetota bacterium]|jgi:hypothetical protein
MSRCLACQGTGVDADDEPCEHCDRGLRVRNSASELQRTHKNWLWTKCVKLARDVARDGQEHPERQGMAVYGGEE